MHTIHSNILDIQKTGYRAQYTVGRLMSSNEVDEATEDYDHLTRQRVALRALARSRASRLIA